MYYCLWLLDKELEMLLVRIPEKFSHKSIRGHAGGCSVQRGERGREQEAMCLSIIREFLGKMWWTDTVDIVRNNGPEHTIGLVGNNGPDAA